MLPHFPGVKNLDLVIDFDPKFDVAPPLLLYGPLDVDSSIVEYRQYNLDVRPWVVEERTVELEPYGVHLAGIERCLSKRERNIPIRGESASPASSTRFLCLLRIWTYYSELGKSFMAQGVA